MAAIDIGPGATDRGSNAGAPNAIIDEANPANATGIITSVELWAVALNPLIGCLVGTFYTTGANQLKCRASTTIGDVPAGSKQTFSGLSIAVVTSDYIGVYFAAGIGKLEMDTSGGTGIWYTGEPQFDPGDEAVYNYLQYYAISIYGIGETAITEKTSSDTGSGVEALTQTVLLVKADTGGGVESLLSRALVLPETGSGVDALVALLYNAVVSDTGSGLDAVIELTQLIEKLSSDAGTGIDALTALKIALTQSDTGTGLDTALLLAALIGADTGLGLDELLSLAKAIIALDYAIGTDRFIALIRTPTKGGDMRLPTTKGQVSIPSGEVSIPSKEVSI